VYIKHSDMVEAWDMMELASDLAGDKDTGDSDWLLLCALVALDDAVS
jgi:hypothetical protein